MRRSRCRSVAFVLGCALLPTRAAAQADRAEREVRRLELAPERGAAQLALWSLGADAVPALVRALHDPRCEVVRAACAVLHEIGPAAAAARPHLERRLRGDGLDQATAAALRWALHGVTATGFAVAAWDRGAVVVLDAQGEAVGSVAGLAAPWDAQPLPGGNLLVTETRGGRVVEVAPDGAVVWRADVALKGPNRATRLLSGNTLIADTNNARVLEVDRSGLVVWQARGYSATWCHRLLDGHTLLVEHQTDRLVELDAAGQKVRQIAIPDEVYGACPLPGGHVLLAVRSGEPRLVEVDWDGRIVAELPAPTAPNACLRRADGTTVVAGRKRVVAYGPDGEELWQRAVAWAGSVRPAPTP